MWHGEWVPCLPSAGSLCVTWAFPLLCCRTPVRAGTILDGVNVLVAGDESFKVLHGSPETKAGREEGRGKGRGGGGGTAPLLTDI